MKGIEGREKHPEINFCIRPWLYILLVVV